MALGILGRTAIAATTALGGGGAAALTMSGNSSGTATPAELTAATSPTSSSGSTATAPAKCGDADSSWPGYVQGQPSGFDAHDDGVYLWHNPTGGWGLRVSHPLLPGKANRVVFTGRIRTRGQVADVKKVRDEKGDTVRVLDHGHVLAFHFVNYGGVDGVDFTVGCTPGLRAVFRADRSIVQPNYVHLGGNAVPPASDPFRVRRRPDDTTTAPVKPAHKSGAGAPTTTAPSAQPAPAR